MILLVSILIINYIQNKKPKYLIKCLPKFLQTWEFLPLPLRSLEPYDKIIKKACFCCCKKLLHNNDTNKVHPEEFMLEIHSNHDEEKVSVVQITPKEISQRNLKFYTEVTEFEKF